MMSKIDDLIEELCPDGVEFVTLDDAGVLYSGLRGKSKPDFSSGAMPYVSYLDIANHASLPTQINARVNLKPLEAQNSIQAGDLLFTGSSEDAAGVGLTSEVEYSPGTTTYLNSFCFGFRPHAGSFERGYLKHLFRTDALRRSVIASSNGVTRINVSKKNLVKISIPKPPIKVQREIVSILDKFIQLEADLEAELEARRIQYDETRDGLLEFSGDPAMHALAHKMTNLSPSGIEHLELATLGDLYNGLSGKSKADFLEGDSPFVSYLDIANNSSLPSEIDSKVKVEPHERQNEIRKGDLLFTSSSEDREGIGLTSEVEYTPSVQTFLNSFCFGFRPEAGYFESGYLKHLFRSRTVRNQVKRCSNGVTRINISKSNLVKIAIPIPPREVQKDIVAILDKLEALVSDMTFGLPAEKAARRKQYEYYRNKLLTFKELEAE